MANLQLRVTNRVEIDTLRYGFVEGIVTLSALCLSAVGR
jgi:hypothetical protein